MTLRDLTLDLHGEGHEPAPGAPGDGGREDPGLSFHDLASQGLGGFVGADGAQPREGDCGPRAAHHPSTEAEGIPTPALLLALGEAKAGAFPLAVLRVEEVFECPVQVAEGFLIDALRVLLPPGQPWVLPLHLVPDPVKVDSRVPLLLCRVPLLALIQSPIPGVARRSRVRAEFLFLGGSGVKRESVSLGHPTKPASWGPGLVDLHPSLPVRVAMALSARCAAARRP